MSEAEGSSQGRESSDALAAAKRRRVEMKSAVSQVETAAAAPSGSPGWTDQLLRELDDLRIALEQHIEEVEGHDGLLEELLMFAPRLANKINSIQGEHPELVEQIDRTIEVVKTADEPELARVDVLETLAAVARHRQRGADLVYEGYSVDIGGG